MSLYVGSSAVKDVYVGTGRVKRLFQGSNLVWYKPFKEVISDRDGLTSNATTVTFTLPAGCIPGDTVFYFTTINAGSTNTLTYPSGHVKLSGPDNAGGSNNAYALYVVLDSTIITAGGWTVTYASSGRPAGSGIVVPDLDTSNPVETMASPTIVTGASVVTPNGTTTRDHSHVISAVTMRAGMGAVPTMDFGAGWEKDASSGTAFSSGANERVAIGHRSWPGVAGVYGGNTVAATPSPTNYVAYTIATRRAA